MRIRVLHTEAFRLSAIYVAIFAVSVLAMGVLVLFITRQALQDQILQASRTDLAAIARGYASEEAGEAREVVEQLMGTPGSSDFLLLQHGGQRVAGNLPAMAPRAGIVHLPAQQGHGEVLGVGQQLAPDIYAFSGSSLAPLYATQSQILRTLLWLFGAALLLAAVGGVLVSRAFLRRSDAMAKACRAIMDGDMQARIPLRGTRDEMDRLAATINAMLDRIAGLVENLRQVTNDVAHDLRTPVTHLRHGLERALQEGDHAAALDAAIHETDAILELFAALLRIAQIESGARRAAFAPLALDGVLRDVAALLGPVAEETGHRLVLPQLDKAIIRGDRPLVMQLFTNLVENAILHTPQGTTITMMLAAVNGQAIVTLGDDGPGVPPDEQAKLFRRFYRRESSRGQPGHGLGLALVAAIAELHGATLALRNDRGPGLWFELAFACAPDWENV